jgi:plasmid stability protein
MPDQRSDKPLPVDPAVLHNGGSMEDSMATLNIKNFPDHLYRKLQRRAKVHRRSISQEVTEMLTVSLEQSRQLSILELKGLGKAIWADVDAAKHVDEERRAWD